MAATLVYPNESYYLNGLFYQIHNQLDGSLKEKQYADALELLFRKNGDGYEREKEIPIPFADGEIRGNKMDFIFRGIIVIECKACKYISRDDYRQMIRYLEATGYKLGVIVNFRG